MRLPFASADTAIAADVDVDRRWWRDRDDHVRAARDNLPRHDNQHIPALPQPEGVAAIGAGAGAHGHLGGQGPGLDPDPAHWAGFA